MSHRHLHPQLGQTARENPLQLLHTTTLAGNADGYIQSALINRRGILGTTNTTTFRGTPLLFSPRPISTANICQGERLHPVKKHTFKSKTTIQPVIDRFRFDIAMTSRGSKGVSQLLPFIQQSISLIRFTIDLVERES